MAFRRTAVVAAACALAAGLAACGSDNSNGGSADADGSASGSTSANSSSATTTLKVGVIPIIDVAPLYLGIQKGFFEQQGMKVEPQLAAGGAAIVPAVVSGTYQLGFSNNVSLFIAASKGLPIKIVSAGVGISPSSTAGQSDAGYCEVLAKDRSIRSPADLSGKSVAVNTLNNIGDVTIKAALDRAGVDPDSVRFLEIDFPNMLTALDSGRVDAVWECEPFVSQGLANGDTPVLNNYAATDPNLSVATYFASDKWLQDNPDVARRFVAAMRQSLQYAQAHPDEARAATTRYTGLRADAVRSLGLPEWSADLNMGSMRNLAALTARFGETDGPVDLDQLIQQP